MDHIYILMKTCLIQSEINGDINLQPMKTLIYFFEGTDLKMVGPTGLEPVTCRL